jgi:ATP-dependent Lon protease
MTYKKNYNLNSTNLDKINNKIKNKNKKQKKYILNEINDEYLYYLENYNFDNNCPDYQVLNNELDILNNNLNVLNEKNLFRSINFQKSLSLNNIDSFRNNKINKIEKKNFIKKSNKNNNFKKEIDNKKEIDINKIINNINNNDYSIISTSLKNKGETLLNKEINLKFKSKSNNHNEVNQISRKLKECFKKVIYTDNSSRPDLLKILLDEKLSLELKVKIIKKYIKFVYEEEIFSEEAENLKIEINNLLSNYDNNNDILDQINNKIMPENLKNKLLKLYYNNISYNSSKMNIYINNILSLPYHRTNFTVLKDIFNNNNIDIRKDFIKKIYNELDNKLYGLEYVKNSIISYLCQLFNNKKFNKYICLVGPPGVGKTHIINLLSEILKIPFNYISLANIDESSILLGHSYTFEGSKYGLIAESVINNGCKNGIILFDELDKCNQKVQNSLLGVFDPLQNNRFRDSYFNEFFIDLSETIIIVCLNDIHKLNPILRDRLHIINIEGYSNDEKINIIKKYIIPELNTQFNLNNIIIDDEVIDLIIQKSINHKGIRLIKSILNKIYELLILDLYTNKFNLNNKFIKENFNLLKLDNLDY